MMSLSSVLLDGSLEGGRVGADDLADLLAVLEDEESRHGADGVLLGGLGDLVDVDLEEAGVGVVVGEPVGGLLLVVVSLFWVVWLSAVWYPYALRARLSLFWICNRISEGARGIRT
jgi:hypothetical protein